jgi:DNA-binding NarL/FixJ family response regulator
VHNYLSGVHVPTLVIHRHDDAWFSPDHGRAIANAIGGARYVELPGADHAPYVGATGELLSAVRWFVAEIFPSTLTTPSSLADVGDPRLTPRQSQVVRMVRSGLTDKEVAEHMGLSPRTVQKHLELAYRRLGVTNRTAAATAAHRRHT